MLRLRKDFRVSRSPSLTDKEVRGPEEARAVPGHSHWQKQMLMCRRGHLMEYSVVIKNDKFVIGMCV